MKYQIYTLTCPVKNTIVYVGVTSIGIKKRLKDHLAGTGSVEKTVYTRSIRPFKFSIQVLEVAYSDKKALQVERYWIHQLKEWGFPLLNSLGSNRRVVSCIAKTNLPADEIKAIAKAIHAWESEVHSASKYSMVRESLNIKLINHLNLR